MKKVLFLQVSSVLLHNYSHKTASKYYEDLYRLKDGYEKNDHFWELPLWVVEIDGFLDGVMDTSFRLIDNYEPLDDINVAHFDYILFSVTDANRSHVKKFVDRYTGRAEILAGGYTRIEGLKYFDSPKDLAEYLNVPYRYALNYRHFKGTKTIPRITLSTGCQHNCKFCVTQHWLEEVPREHILHQAEQMSKALEFKYAYVADSTFGQAPNHVLLREAYNTILDNNDDFEGFIIQTTATQLNRPGFIQSLHSLGVRIVEIGMESFNDEILKPLRKPASEKLIRQAVVKLHQEGLETILNVITGLVDERLDTYMHTLEFIEDHQDMLFALNIYTLAIYSDKEYGQEINARPLNGADTARYFYNAIFELATDLL